MCSSCWQVLPQPWGLSPPSPVRPAPQSPAGGHPGMPDPTHSSGWSTSSRNIPKKLESNFFETCMSQNGYTTLTFIQSAGIELQVKIVFPLNYPSIALVPSGVVPGEPQGQPGCWPRRTPLGAGRGLSGAGLTQRWGCAAAQIPPQALPLGTEGSPAPGSHTVVT